MGLALSIAQDVYAKGLKGEDTLESRVAIEAFLREVETRAFRIALMNVRDRDEALDIVQDSMIRLVRRYSRRPSEEWRPLFYRILENRIRDVQRRRNVRNRFMALLPWRGEGREEEDSGSDPIEQAVDHSPSPVAQLESHEALAAVERALSTLPNRQRQAFLLRNFEGLDVAETAAAMKCSEGSVKTHYFRAVQALRAQLGEFWT